MLKEEALYKPFILKRLTDYDPSEKSEGEGGLITGKQLKEDVMENVDMLFHSRSHASLSDLGGYDEIDGSVLGYGISDFCGKRSSTASREALRDHIYRRLRLFEPRLDPASVSVEFQDADGGDSCSLEFRICGNIAVKDVNEEIVFVSKLNLESGGAELRLDAC